MTRRHEEGATLKIQVHVSGPLPIPPLDAVVVRVSHAPHSGPPGHPVGVGVRFVNLSPEALEAVRTYLKRLGTAC